MAHTTQDIIRTLARDGLIWRAEHSALAVPAGASTYLGFVTGDNELEALSRSYSSTGNALVVELFEASFTGGTPAHTINRRLSHAGPPPVQLLTGITPGALGDAITAVRILAPTSTGSAQAGVSADDSLLLLKAQTSYVLRISNTGASAADLGAAIDYRESI